MTIEIEKKKTGLLLNNRIQRHKSEPDLDYLLTSCTHDMMQTRLSDNRAKGRHGWWNSQVCSIDDIRTELQFQLDNDDMLSVCILAAMINARQLMERYK